MDHIAIAGGGLVGCVAATYLARRGMPVTIYERGPDLRVATPAGRPSINLTLCERGLRPLKQIGAEADVQRLLSPAYGRVVHLEGRQCTYQPYGEPGQAIYSARRNELNAALLDVAVRSGVSFRFNSRCVDVVHETQELVIEKDGVAHRERVACVIAADGCFSSIRSRLERSKRLNYSQEFWINGYKELQIPAVSNEPALSQGALHLWPRDKIMAIAFPNSDCTFSCALHMPFSGEVSFAQLNDRNSFQNVMETNFPDLLPLIARPGAAFFDGEPNSMVTIRCTPWSFDGFVLLVGDAAHSIFPSYGQGANAGFEDCAILDRLIEVHGPDWAKVFGEFELARRADTDAIADLCSKHFAELSDHVADPGFQRRNRVEQKLHQLFPRDFSSLYSMVTFTSMPYSEACKRSQAQRELLDRLLEENGIEEKLDTEAVRAQLGAELKMPGYLAAGARVSSGAPFC